MMTTKSWHTILMTTMLLTYVASYVCWKCSALRWTEAHGMHGYYFYPLPADDSERYAVIEHVTRLAYLPLILLDVELLGGERPASYPTHVAPR